MISALYATALGQGFFGSGHCLGMCGPLVVLLHGNHSQNRGNAKVALLYNFFRILSYALVGFLLGTLGMGLDLFFLKDFAFYLGIAFVLFFALGFAFPHRFPHLQLPLPTRLLRFLAKNTSSDKSSYGNAILLGSITGLLPCGLLFPAYALTFLAPTPWESSLVMVFFGLGNLPLLLGMSLFSSRIWNYFSHPKFRVLLAVFLILFSLFTIYQRVYLTPSEEECHTPTQKIPD